MTPLKISVGGFASNVGKTTLVCELLGAFRGWEAIKVTRGHYRSCGKDPHACCVSHLLSEEPRLVSGRAKTYAPGKDTGRYWEAGASNVHWLVATDAQVERGVREALGRVRSRGVVVEGNSPLMYFAADFFVMVLSRTERMKPTARRVFDKADALYLHEGLRDGEGAEELLAGLGGQGAGGAAGLPLYTRESLADLFELIRRTLAGRAPGAAHARAHAPAKLRALVLNKFEKAGGK